MKVSQLRKLIREVVRKTLNEKTQPVKIDYVKLKKILTLASTTKFDEPQRTITGWATGNPTHGAPFIPDGTIFEKEHISLAIERIKIVETAVQEDSYKPLDKLNTPKYRHMPPIDLSSLLPKTKKRWEDIDEALGYFESVMEYYDLDHCADILKDLAKAINSFSFSK